MAVIWTEESKFVKEMAKHEQHQSKWTLGDLKPGNPYVYRPYPRMLYKAHKRDNGKYEVALPVSGRHLFLNDGDWQRHMDDVLRFNSECQKTVETEREHQKAREDGWMDSMTEALDFHKKLDDMVAKAAAERNYQDRNMSDGAKAEAAQFESEQFGHVAEIPTKAKRKYTRRTA